MRYFYAITELLPDN